MKITAGNDRTPWLYIVPFCDGVRLHKCLMIDTEAGEAVCYRTDAAGELLYEQKGDLHHPVIEVRRGHITLELSEHAKVFDLDPERPLTVDAFLALWSELQIAEARHRRQLRAQIRQARSQVCKV
jgi:hypothetical protein